MSHPYQYVVLRYIPRVDRGESVNVGVVLHSQEAGVLTCSWHLDAARLTAFSPDTDLVALEDALHAVCRVCEGSAAADVHLDTLGKRFGWLSAPRSTVLQPGPIHGGAALDPEAEAERLVDLLVR